MFRLMDNQPKSTAIKTVRNVMQNTTSRNQPVAAHKAPISASDLLDELGVGWIMNQDVAEVDRC